MKMRLSHLLCLPLGLFLLAGGLLVAGGAISQAAAQEPSVRIINGSPSGNKAVVQVLRQTRTSSSLCSGSLIAKSWVLTAWHCVGTKASEMRIVANGRTYKVKKIHRHPNVSEDPQTGFLINDVALLKLKNSVRGVTPLALLTSRGSVEGDNVLIYGYGLTENNDFGRQLVGLMQLDAVTTELLFAVYDSFDSSDTCSGDSGGPAVGVYVDSNGRTRAGIVGVISAGTQADCSIGDVADFINIQSNAVLRFITRKVSSVKFQ